MPPAKVVKNSNTKSNKNNVDKELAALDGFADTIKRTEESDFDELKSMLKSMSTDMREMKQDIGDIRVNINDIKNDIRSLDDEVKSLKIELNSVEDRVTSVEGNVTNIRGSIATVNTLCSKLALMNKNIDQEMKKQEDNTKSKQALFHSEVDAEKSDFVGRIRALFANIGVDSTTSRIIDVQRFNKLKYTVLLSFPSIALKSDFYSLLKQYRTRNNNSKTFMNEFLTHAKYELLKKCLNLKRSGKLHSAYSFDNKVFVKKNNGDNPKLIRGADDVTALE